MANPKARIVWHECLTSDTKKAIDFYTNLVGWTVTTFETPGGGPPYNMWTAPRGTVGGTMELPADAKKMGAPSHWLMYLGVDDVNASTALATKLGATTFVPPTDIPTVGRFSVMADPQGAMYALFTPEGNQPGPPDGTPQVGEFSWHELATSDLPGALAFYKELAGWEVRDTHDMGPEMGFYQIFGRPGTPAPMGGMMKRPPTAPVSAWTCYVRVADIDAASAKIEPLGGKKLMGPHEVPGGDRITLLQDPLGAMFAMHQTKNG